MPLHKGVCGHCKRVCTESWLWEKNPLPHQGIEPASAACRSYAQPPELHPHPRARRWAMAKLGVMICNHALGLLSTMHIVTQVSVQVMPVAAVEWLWLNDRYMNLQCVEKGPLSLGFRMKQKVHLFPLQWFGRECLYWDSKTKTKSMFSVHFLYYAFHSFLQWHTTSILTVDYNCDNRK